MHAAESFGLCAHVTFCFSGILLVSLDVSSNQLSGFVPAELGNLVGLSEYTFG